MVIEQRSFILAKVFVRATHSGLFLFILCSEGFSLLLTRNEAKGGVNGIKICHGAPIESHLLYIDNILVACKTNNSNAKAIK